jgi:hypothetical protein
MYKSIIPLVTLALSPPLISAPAAFTFSGVTTVNQFVSSAVASEFPVGTKWTVRVEWDSASAPLFLSATQSSYRATVTTITLQGKSGPWTTSSKADQAKFGINAFGSGSPDEIQFTSGWGPTNHTNPTLLDMMPYSANVTLSDPTGTAFGALSPAPSMIDLSKFSATSTATEFKFYLSDSGASVIYGNIQFPTARKLPEISVWHPKGKELVDGKATKNFGVVAVMKSGKAQTFVIRNTGKSTLGPLKIKKAGPHGKDFSISKLSKTSLSPGTSASFKVTFNPEKAGLRKAALKIANNDPNENSFDIKLVGKGK